ncbi:hypothetical protein [Sphingobium sp.]|uniref:hypothetical protein n=1 Tax=Sphingobium sp. TaxID=1912891 RepID=UPI002B93FBF4|nr:hypothetical protein [Sphingobium sp.]HUD94723.1 hypothetical protein [Sphingobium sp.]
MVENDPSARRYVDRLRSLLLIRQISDGTLPLEWAPVRLLSDNPAKVLGGVADGDLLAPRLEQALGVVQRELGVIAGYFVPGGRRCRAARGPGAGGQAGLHPHQWLRLQRCRRRPCRLRAMAACTAGSGRAALRDAGR